MSNASEENEISQTYIPSEFVHRAATRRDWIDMDTGEILATAYIRRANERPGNPHGDPEGLSVDNPSMRSCADFSASFNKCYAVLRLPVAHIESLDLQVVPDPPPPSHALIQGMPNNIKEEERLAGLLAKASVFVWRRDA